ncbi:MAG: hypothetical protein HYV59_07910 [Planctomycetes bacterium]|nr:hypothetical protein [Planctomycetota bacterium]
MYKQDNLLFYEGDLGATLRNQTAQIAAKVDGINKDQVRATPEDDLVQHIFAEFEIVPLTLHEDSTEMEQHETRVDVSGDRDQNVFGDRGPIYVSGIRVVVTIPYSGNPALWKLRPNQWQSVFPRAEVRQPDRNGVGYLDIVIEQPTDAPQEKIKQRLESELKSIRFYVNSQKSQVEQFNATAPDVIRRTIVARKERIRTHNGVADILGIPLKRRGDAPAIQPIPIKRTLVRPLPPPPKSGFKSEPGISDEDYEHILSVIRHEGRTFEVTPKTYAVHDEEELRDIILAHLNGHYQGGATGETFRRSGKTDIRIEDHERAAFVAKCKVWRGAKELTAAIDQLLSYLTWRDCKAAIVVFNKNNAKFTELLSKVPDIIRAHQRFKKALGQRGDGEWRFVFSSAEDELRQVIVSVFVFNIYVA